MADKKISALNASTTPLAGTEVLPIVQAGSTVKVNISDVTAGRAVSALSGSFGTGTPAYSIGGTQIGVTNTSANAYLSIYGGVGSTNGGFLLGGNNAENFANLFWSNGSNFMQIATTPVSSKVQFNIAGVVVGDITSAGFAFAAGKGVTTSSATALGLGVNGAVTAMTIDTSSNVGVGTTSPTTGSMSNGAILNAGVFATLKGSVASTSGVAVTIAVANQNYAQATYIVSVGISSAAPTVYSAVAIVSADNNTLRSTTLQIATNMTISVSGTNIQATQTSGGAATILYTITRVA